MAFLRSVTASDVSPTLYGEQVVMRIPQMSDFENWTSLRADSRAFLTPWEPTWPRDDLTKPAFRRRIRRYQRDVREGHSFPFFIYNAISDELVGGLTLSNIRRGVSQSCSLGYWVGEPYARKGHMYDAVQTIMPFVFDNLLLHRLEAACLPVNEPSARLLLKCGFSEEGYARRYLRINGVWQDHLLFAVLSEDLKTRDIG
ncbi:MAG: GNAT family N-acetyltransferase [Hyphomicrobiales bacterium]